MGSSFYYNRNLQLFHVSGSPVSLEAGNAIVGERVLHCIHEDLEGDGRDISTGESALGDMLRFFLTFS